MQLVINPDNLFSFCGPEHMSGSAAELGPNAGKFTWERCLEAAKDHISLFQGVDYDALREHFNDYGAWDQEAVNGWNDEQLRALAIQEIAADYRYQTEQDASEDQVRHLLAKDGLIYCYFGC